MRIIVTGGAGFIGSSVSRYLVGTEGHEVLNIDKLAYAANLHSLVPIANQSNYHFLKADICNQQTITEAFESFQPDAVLLSDISTYESVLAA